MKKLGKVKAKLPSFLTIPLDGCKWSPLGPGYFTPNKKKTLALILYKARWALKMISMLWRRYKFHAPSWNAAHSLFTLKEDFKLRGMVLLLQTRTFSLVGYTDLCCSLLSRCKGAHFLSSNVDRPRS